MHLSRTRRNRNRVLTYRCFNFYFLFHSQQWNWFNNMFTMITELQCSVVYWVNCYQINYIITLVKSAVEISENKSPQNLTDWYVAWASACVGTWTQTQVVYTTKIDLFEYAYISISILMEYTCIEGRLEWSEWHSPERTMHTHFTEGACAREHPVKLHLWRWHRTCGADRLQQSN